MASTSTSSVQKSFTYDVFLSFRGEDTRNTFVGHLYNALQQNGIETYKDDEKIKKGETIDTQLINSIKDSRFFIIVFSKNYASSSWCLDELVKIMECQKTTEQTAYPVFYDVEPTEVRKQNGAVEEAFKEHINKAAAGKWRQALKEAADLAGWELKKTANGDESKLIQIVVDDIFKKICLFCSSFDEKLVGMEMRINKVLSSLEMGTEDVRMIGIKGIGGGGKTTLATAIFNQISHQFEGSSFVENVREVSKNSLSGLKELQKQILTDIFSNQDITVSSVSGGINKMTQMMHRKKVFVVLDDVDSTVQLEALAGDLNWYKPGSRIIVTTRDEQVLVAHRVSFINNVTLLSHTEAIRLFNRYAFTKKTPTQGHKELSRQVVKYADGLPLTIKVLGSLLCGQNEPQWKDALERLKTIPLKETMKILELSYDALEEDYKEIFLDVACLLKGWEKKDVIRVLESCGFHAIYGLTVLEQKSLITISESGRVGMHDHIEEMGKNIVRRLHPNSRLWIQEEIEEILANESGTQATKCISLDAEGLNFEILMNGLANMNKLRFLYLKTPYLSEAKISNWNFDEDNLRLPNALRYLSWDSYPFSSLPKTFEAKNLVGLDMYFSNIVQLWKDGEEKACLKLRFLKFTFSRYLRTLDLSVSPNLETLILGYCDDLEKLHMPAECPKLVNLHLSNLKLRTLDLSVALNLETLILKSCHNLVEVHFQVTPNLKELCIYDCNRMEKLHMPAECPRLVNLDLDDLKLRTLHLKITPNLETLRLINCTDMVELCMPTECPKLVNVQLWNSKLTTLHLGITPNLESLSLRDCTDMVEFRMPAECPKLVNLNLSNLKLRTLHLGITPNLETLSLLYCTDMVELHIAAECPKLLTLNLNNDAKLRTLDLGLTPNLETLRLNNCTDMVVLQIPAECTKLAKIKLSYLKLKTFYLWNTPNLEMLRLNNCTDMVELQIPAECRKLVNLELGNLKLKTLHLRITPNLEMLRLNNCTDMLELEIPGECPKLVILDLNIVALKTLDLGNIPNLKRRFKSFVFNKKPENATVGSLSELHLIAESIGTCPLHSDNNLPKFRFKCFYKEGSVSQLGNLEKLLSFGLCACTNLESFSGSISGLRCLRKLTLEGCIPEAPRDLDQLECLEELVFWSTRIKHLPNSICMLKHLKSLELNSCWLIDRLPKDLVRLECLEELYLTECILLRDIPESMCGMNRLKYFHLPYCMLVEKLPEELGRLECLKELNIEGTGISRLPLSIFRLEGLRILGTRWRLESYGFTSVIQHSKYTSFCYV